MTACSDQAAPRTQTRRPWLAAAAWLVVCSALFVIVYNGCTWITSRRSDVGTWFYDWEFRIPFVPAMIVPYWSIDLLFVGAFFLCSSRTELDALGKRIAAAILIAGACFLAMPLRLGFPRPEVSDFCGALFNALRGFDQPYNLCPSLHMALRTILAYAYARHMRGAPRVATHVWFSIVGFSTVLTYQHHVVDVAGGFVLAAVCFYMFRETDPRQPVTRNPRIGLYYITGAVATAAMAFIAWPAGALLLWPAAAMAIMATAYAGAGPGVFRKTGGRLPLSTRLVLGPVLVGQWLSFHYYRRQCPAWNAVTPRVWIGRRLNDAEAAEAVRQGVTAVLDLTGEFSEAAPFRAVAYRNLSILDLTAPPPEQLAASVGFIASHAVEGVVYVHCKIGYSRSAAVVGAWLLASGHAADATQAMTMLRSARPSIIIRPEAEQVLRAESLQRGAHSR